MAEPQQCRSGVLGPGPLQAVLGPSSRGVVVGQAELCFPSGLLAESTSKWSPKPLGVHAARVRTAGLMADALVQHPRQDVRAFSLQCRMRARASAGSLSLLSWLSASPLAGSLARWGCVVITKQVFRFPVLSV